MQKRQKRKTSTPWFMLGGILSVLLLIAVTDLMDPVIRFIHNDQGTSWQLIVCALVGILGFRIAYLLLNIICNYYSNLFDERLDKGNQSKL